MIAALGPADLAALALFPLPRAVLFPGARLPLHVFEARYRRMLADCLDSGRMTMAVVQLQPGGHAQHDARPPIQPIAGAGRIVRQRKNADGTYDIELTGVARVRLHELELAGLPYRRARAEVLGDQEPDGGIARAELGALWSLAAQIGQHVRRIDGRFTLQASPTDEASALADRIADQLVTDPDIRQQILETLAVDRRVELVRSHLARLHLALLASESTETRTLH